MAEPAHRRGDVWPARLDKVRPVVVLIRDPMGGRIPPVGMAEICQALSIAVGCDR